MTRSSLFTALTLLTAAACASAGPAVEGTYQQDRLTFESPGGQFDVLLTRQRYLSSDTITTTPARAWSALVQTYSELGIPLQGADPTNHMIATQYAHVHGSFAGERLSRWIDCGSSITGDVATMYEVTLRLGTIIDTSAAPRSVLRTAVSASAVAPGSGTTPVDCNTRGALEKRIAALVISKSR
jgi:hypothetical protein